MFGLSMWELLVIALVILFVVGPKRLPDVAKSIGKGYGEFKRTFNEMKQSVNIEDNVQYTKKPAERTDKIQTYAEQYKSQWEDKFDTNTSDSSSEAGVRKSKFEDNENNQG